MKRLIIAIFSVCLVANLCCFLDNAYSFEEPKCEVGDAIYRSGVTDWGTWLGDLGGALVDSSSGDAWHAGIYGYYNGFVHFVFEQTSDNVVRWAPYDDGSTEDCFLNGNESRGAANRGLSKMSDIARETIVFYAKDQVGISGYYWLYRKSPDDAFRCDGFVEYCYEQTFGDYGCVENDMEWFLTSNSPYYQYHNLTPTTVVSPTVKDCIYSLVRNTSIEIHFSEMMLLDSLIPENITISTTSPEVNNLPFSIQYYDNHDILGNSTFDSYSCSYIIIDPVEDFQYGSQVTITISDDVKDLAGNIFDGDNNGIEGGQWTHAFNIESDPGPEPTSLNISANLPTSGVPAYGLININGTVFYNTGKAVPVGVVTIDTGSEIYTAPVSMGNFNRNIHAPSTSGTIYITVKEDVYNLSAAVYPSINIIGDETGSGYNLVNCDVIYDRDESGGEIQWWSKEAFKTTDAYVETLLYFEDVYQQLNVRWEYYKPDGNLYGNVLYGVIPSPESHWDYYWISNGWQINNYATSFEPGLYSVKVYIDDGSGYKLHKTKFFTIQYDFVEHKMCEQIEQNSPYDPVRPTNVFYQDNATAYTWGNLNWVAQSTQVRWEWYEPSGNIYGEPSYFTIPDPSNEGHIQWDWYRVWGSINIDGALAKNQCGNWQVKVYVRNAANNNWDQLYDDYFQILERPAVAPDISVYTSSEKIIETQVMNLNLDASDNTYLESVEMHWEVDGVKQPPYILGSLNKTQENMTHNIGIFNGGQKIEYWGVAKDTSGNSHEAQHHTITIAEETIAEPESITGNENLQVGQIGIYIADGSTTDLGHSVEYQFDWGDSAGYSNWDSSSQSYSWASEGNYFVRARARCQEHNNRESAWSAAFMVSVDSTNPTVEITTSGGNDFTAANSQITIEGTSQDIDPSSGLVSTIISTGQSNGGTLSDWNFTLDLVLGDNVLTVTTIDNAGNESSDTITITYNGTSANVPAAPLNLSATAGDGYIDLAWDVPLSDGGSAITNYQIYRGGSPDSEELYYTTLDVSTTYRDNSVTNGTTYYYKVLAVNSVGLGPLSNEVSVMPEAQILPVISGYIKTPNGDPIYAWVTFSNVVGQAFTDGNGFYTQEVPTGWTGTLTPASPVYEFDPVEQSLVNVTLDISNVDFTALRKPNISGTVETSSGDGIGGVVMTFSGGQGDVTTSPGGNYEKIVPHSWSGTVTPSNGGDNFEPASITYTDLIVDMPNQNFTTAAAAIIPTAPRNLSATAGDGYVDLDWDVPNSDGGASITNYEIHRSTSSDGEQLFHTTSDVSTTYRDSNVTNGTTYYYKVLAVNSVGNGPLSNEDFDTPQAGVAAPLAPLNLTVIAGDGYVDLDWDVPASDGGSAITDYQIYRSTSSGVALDDSYVLTGNTLTNYRDNNVENGTTYYYKVAAENSVGIGSLSDEYSAIPQIVVIYVDADNGGFEDGTGANPFNTIQEGVDAATQDGIVHVAAGTYNEAVIITTDGVNLIGANKETTIISTAGGNGQISYPDGSIAFCDNSTLLIAASDIIIENFTISNATDDGIVVFPPNLDITQIEIKNNIIRDCYKVGILINCPASDIARLNIENNLIINNAGDPVSNGIGVWQSGSVDCFLSNNIMYGNNHGVIIEGGEIKQIYNNTIVKNKFSGVRINNVDEVWLENNIISGNATGVEYIAGIAVMIQYNDVWGNTGGNYTGMADQTGVVGNISVDPLFVDDVNNNYHLKTESLCRDGGNANSYMNDVDNTRNDMGVDGGPLGVEDITIPQAIATALPSSGVAPLQVTFNSSASSDEWGIASCSWDFNSSDGIQQDSIEPNPTYSYTEAGKYFATLTVTDNSGLEGSDITEEIEVLAANIPPSVSAIATPMSGSMPLNVNFSGLGTDTDGTIVSYSWDFDSSNGIQQDGTGQANSHSYYDEGGYIATLTVTDDDGATASTTIAITVVDDKVNIEESGTIDANIGGTVEIVNPLHSMDGIGVNVPANALQEDTLITIGIIMNPPAPPADGFGSPYDFGPAGTNFSAPVTISIPHAASAVHGDNIDVYYYDTISGVWSSDGITDVVHDGSGDPHIVSFKTTHFSVFQLASTIPVVVPPPPVPDTGGGSAGSGGGCFIATAAYGTSMAKEVKVLCKFRDEYLLNHKSGKVFVGTYYGISPALARYIEDKELIKSFVRIILKPLVKACELAQ